MPTKHTVRSYDEELRRLANTLTQMGGLAESQLAAAMQAVSRRDGVLAAEIVSADLRVDQLETEVDQQVMRLLALRQPVGPDLREIVSSLKIAADLERIADYAANVAKRSIALNQTPPVRPAFAIPRMGAYAQAMIKDVLDAYVERDAERAVAVWRRDEELDEMYTSLFRELLTYMMEDPRSIGAATHLLFMAKNVERIGDHATNIAETIHFLVRGDRLRELRPKGDRSTAVIPQPRLPLFSRWMPHEAAGPGGGGRGPLLTLLRYNLEKEGFRVAEARDGEEALVAVKDHKPDLVLLDWMLPLVSGIEVCRQIRRMPEARSCRSSC